MQSTVSVASQAIQPCAASKNEPFPFLDLKAQFATIEREINGAVARVFESQQLILGPEVVAFETEIAAMVGCEFAIACASGSDALLLALMANGIGPGDEVITTPFTFVATAGAIARLGARPVFVDIDGRTYNIDPNKLADAVSPRTRAILPVHLFGLPADLDAILQLAESHKVPVIEDAAQAIGSQLNGKQTGSIGQAGCFSFFPSKNLGGAGDGGMIVTNDRQIADRLKLLRLHGSRQKYSYEIVGMNSRLDALQAAILRVKFKHLPAWTEGRQRNADRYRSLFADAGLAEKVVLPSVPNGRLHVYNQFVIRTKHRDALRQAMKEKGIPTEVYYPSPLHLQMAFSALGYSHGAFPVAEAACDEVLALPIYPELSEAQQGRVVESIADFLLSSKTISGSNNAAD